MDTPGSYDRFAERVRGLGPVCDLGCGPAQVARYLHERGIPVLGVDASAGMVAEARRLNPSLDIRQGDMRALDVPDDAWGGIVAFYSLIHIPRDEMVVVLRELRRVLQPGGWLTLAFHLGDETIHLDEWFDTAVDLDFTFFRREEMEGYLREAGFADIDGVERPPYPDVEVQTHRAYLFARKPEPSS
ncbi:MAG: class I SAM-dependent methyltransferase [Dehalococcoidia bacterium]